MTHTDNRGFEADRIGLTIDDSDGLVSMPARGAKVTLAFGWQGQSLISKGEFVVDEVSHQGPPESTCRDGTQRGFPGRFQREA